MMIKLTDAVRRYNGEGDVTAWIERFEMVCKLQQKPTESPPDQATILPLFLEGAAYDVYAQLPAEVQEDATALKKELHSAFGLSPLLAYAKFKARELMGGEAPDAMLADLRRLARAIEGGDGKAMEPVVLCQFVDGLPEPTRGQLQALKSGSSWTTAEVLACAKGLLQRHNETGSGGLLGHKVSTHQRQGPSSSVAATVGPSAGATGEVRGTGQRRMGAGPGVRCSGCFKWGHRQVECQVRCFGCNGVGHLRRLCPQEGHAQVQGNEVGGGSLRASCPPVGVLKVDVELDGKRRKAVVDTGCSYTLVRVGAGRVTHGEGEGVLLETMDGKFIRTQGEAYVQSMVVSGKQLGPRKVQVMERLPLSVDIIVGLDVVLEHGLVVNSEAGRVQVDFHHGKPAKLLQCGRDAALVGGGGQSTATVAECRVADKDFDAWFDGGKWTIKWKWSEECPPSLSCQRPNYKVPADDREAFDTEIKTWIAEGILVPWVEEEHGTVRNVVPLLSVKQSKGSQLKVRPCLDFKKLNEGIVCLSGGLPTCDERLRQWRSMGPHGSLVDLKRAYLQVHVDKALWVYQAVRWEGQTYLLTRLGFGVNVAPRVMTAIVEKVLGLDEEVKRVSSSYIDDIFCVGESEAAELVRRQLKRYGLVTKEAVRLGDESGVRVLGLAVGRDLSWSRDSSLPAVTSRGVTRRALHSWIGELIGHFPVAGWLRVAGGYLQRCTANEKIGWDSPVSEETQTKVNDVVANLRNQGDPVCGVWPVDCQQAAVLWADASSLAIGVALEIGGSIVEDASWLRKVDDSSHINMSELDAVIRGISLCLRWNVRQFTIKTDSATVFGWLKSVFERTHRVRTHALGEMLIRRRIEMLSELAKQEGLSVVVQQVESARNRADQLTRVPNKWLVSRKKVESKSNSDGAATGLVAPAIQQEPEEAKAAVTRIHQRHHFGVDRTWELARLSLGHVSRQMVKSVVSECRQCAMIDPAVTFRWQEGTLASNSVWQRLAVDITHVNGRAYLSCTDCNSRFTIWRSLQNESAKEICTHLARIFAEMGPAEEIFSDNGTVFHSVEMRQLLNVWEIKADFSCAYRPQGNGIAERVHRTIKRMVARSGRSVEEMTFWYNATQGEKLASPFEMVFGAKPRMPGVTEKRREVQRDWPARNVQTAVNDTRADAERNPFVVGDQVFLKQGSRCDRPWSGPHRVSDVKSSVSVSLDGLDIPRHVSHMRRVPVPRAAAEPARDDIAVDDDEDDDDHHDDGDVGPTEVTENPGERYPRRDRSVPPRFGMEDKSEPVYH
jgi:hypothetical protein